MSVGRFDTIGTRAPETGEGSPADGRSARAHPGRPPALALAALSVLGVLVAVGCIVLATAPGWLGARLAPSDGGCAEIVALTQGGPLQRAGAKVGDCLLSIDGGAGAITLTSADLIEDPDLTPTQDAQATYLQRQTELARALAAPMVKIVWRHPWIEERRATIQPGVRPLATLPVSFWLGVLSGFIGLVIGGWLQALRRDDPATAWVAAAGFGLLCAAMSSAIYTSRELAIDGDIQRALSIANHFGGVLLAASLVCFFLTYPLRIGPRWLGWATLALFGASFVADMAKVDTPVSFYTHDSVRMAAVLMAWAAQVLKSGSEPSKRAALSWLGMFVAFVVLAGVLGMIGPIAIGVEPLFSQNALYALFALFFISIAVGVERHTMFDLGRWSYRILYYAVGAAAMIAIDAGLVYGLHVGRGPALMASMLVIGVTYLPAREAVWRRYAAPRRRPPHEFFGVAMDVAFSRDEIEQDKRWRALLSELFEPLDVESAGVSAAVAPTLAARGAEMIVPAVAGSPALLLRYPYGGKALFSAADVEMTGSIIELVRRAAQARADYGRGVIEERARIARDLHDDLGARLLSGAVGPDTDARALSLAALQDLRSILSSLNTDVIELDEGLANVRQETAERIADAGMVLDWPPIDERLASHKIARDRMKALTSCVREAVSNAIRHSRANMIAVRVSVDGAKLRVDLTDDGRGVIGEVSGEAAAFSDGGRGLTNMRERMRAADGEARFHTSETGVTVALEMPLKVNDLKRQMGAGKDGIRWRPP